MIKAILVVFALCCMGATLMYTEREIERCVENQVLHYRDTCGESASGYEEMDGYDAHFEGVKCGSRAVAQCLGVPLSEPIK